jgi:NAD(P) transhydrogenase
LPHYDLVVIGSGPAGEKGAAQAAYFGKRVAVVEKAPQVGGASTNTGTLPSKTLRETALYFSGLRQRGLYGIDYSLKEGLTVPDFMYRETQVVARQRETILRNLANHKVEVVPGLAAFEDPRTLVVRGPQGETPLTAEIFLVAAGSRPNRPADIPFDDHLVYDSDSILRMDEIPKSLVVVGGGVIGCEYASMLACLGIQVSLVDSKDRLLTFIDAEISERLRTGMEKVGVRTLLNERLDRIENDGGSVHVVLKSGRTIEAERALFAAGRLGSTGSLGLDKAGVALDDRGLIRVNDHFQTAQAHIYAAGDVIGFPALASTSMEQARVAMCHAFQFKYKSQVASLLPFGIYTIPEVSAAGETEESCREKGIACEVGRAHYENNARGQIIGDTNGLLKLVFAREDLKLLGVHCVGESATELVHLGLMVLTSGGGIDTFIQAVFNFPTLSEMYKYAAYDGLGNLAGHKMREG